MIVDPDPSVPLSDEQRELLDLAYPDVERLRVAFALARDLETCRALLDGQPVDERRLDQDELQRARRHTLVQLRRPIDLLIGDDS